MDMSLYGSCFKPMHSQECHDLSLWLRLKSWFKAYVKIGNFFCNLSHNFVVMHVAQKISQCNIPCHRHASQYFVAAIIARSRNTSCNAATNFSIVALCNILPASCVATFSCVDSWNYSFLCTCALVPVLCTILTVAARQVATIIAYCQVSLVSQCTTSIATKLWDKLQEKLPIVMEALQIFLKVPHGTLQPGVRKPIRFSERMRIIY